MYIPRFTLRDNVALRLLKLYLYMADVTGRFKAALHKANRLVVQCINGMISNPIEGEIKIASSKFTLKHCNIYIYIYMLFTS